ncbi:MAG: hypothetical protein K2P84_13450, partial [Undibacterium sp.]|nr:hypothetical protein [Undibacterium sp.]
MTKKWMAAVFCLLLTQLLTQSAQTVYAASQFPSAKVPDQLKSWIPWVLDGAPNLACPHRFSDVEQRTCAWAGVLELKAGTKGGDFAQAWQVYGDDTWITLPGDVQHWPVDVLVDGKAVAVISRNDQPVIQLAAGSYRVTGHFVWNGLPESLGLAGQAGLLRLELNGQLLSNPVRDEENRLWLQRKVETKQENQVQVRVARKLSDGVPLLMETRFHLEVSGASREMKLGRALLPEFIAQSINSPLPTCLTAEGDLVLQARAGSWDISLIARHPTLVTRLLLPPSQELLAEDEVWVFEAMPLLRTSSVEGATAIDPSQAFLPPEWRTLPA